MRVAKIDEYPELKDTLAELTADNVSQEKIAEQMGVRDRGTISEWQKRPEIQIRVTRLIQERSNRILSQTTKQIEGLLTSNKKLSVDTILKIHREFAGQLLKIETGGEASKALEELFMAAHDDQKLAEGLQALGIEVRRDEAEDDEDAPAVEPPPAGVALPESGRVDSNA